MYITIENEKGFYGKLKFNSIWNPILSLLVKKSCEHVNDYKMMDKLNTFKCLLDDLGFVKKNCLENNFLDINNMRIPSFGIGNTTPAYKIFSTCLEYGSGLLDVSMFSCNKDIDKNECIYGFTGVVSFIPTKTMNEFVFIKKADYEGIGLEALQGLIASKEACEIYKELMFFLTGNLRFAKQYINICRKMLPKYEDIKIQEYDVVEKIISDTTYVIFNPNIDGYISDKSQYVGISSARLFSTAIEAENYCQSRGMIKDLVIVETKIAVTSINDNHPLPSSGIGLLKEGMVRIEKESIVKNMNEKVVQDLKNRIAFLEQEIKILKDHENSSDDIISSEFEKIKKRRI